MKKILIVSLIILSSTVSYGRVVRVKPVSKPIIHKSAIKPNAVSSSSKNIVKPKTTNNYIIPTAPIKSSNISSFYQQSNSSGGFGIFDFLLLNSIINNNHKTIIKEVDNIDENKIIAILEKEIQEEKSKEKPDDKKIKEYQELLNKIRKEK